MDIQKKEHLPEKAAFWVGVSLLVLVALFQGQAMFLSMAAPWPGWLMRLLALTCGFVCFWVPFFVLKQGGRALGYVPQKGRSRVPVWVLLPLFMGVVLALNSVLSLLQMLAGLLFEAVQAKALPLPQDGVEFLLYFLQVCVLSPLMEELLFRGGVQPLLRLWGRRCAILLTALAFTLLHTGGWELPAVLVLGLALGFVYEVSRSVRACVVLHFANNTAAFLLQLAQEKMQTNAGFALVLWLMILLVAAFIGAVWAVRYFKLGRKLWLKRDAIELGSLRARLWRLFKVPAFLLGMVALVTQFIVRMG